MMMAMMMAMMRTTAMMVMKECRRNTCLETSAGVRTRNNEDSVVAFPPLKPTQTTYNYLMGPLNAVSSVLLEKPFS